MNRTLSALAVAAALSGASAAQADTFSPPATLVTFAGDLNMQFGGISITCPVTWKFATTALDSAGDNRALAAMSLAAGAGGLCSLAHFPGVGHEIVVSSPSPPPDGVTAQKLKIVGLEVVFNAMTMTCGPGDIEVIWNPGTPPSITFPAGAELRPPTPGCRFSGALYQGAGPILSIVN